MKYTLGTASKATGKSKSTLSRDIKGGRISAARQPDGSYEIDPAELHRVYPALERGTGSRNGISNDQEPLAEHRETPASATELASVRARLEVFEAERERERAQLLSQIEDVKRDRDHWRQQATALLTDQRETTEQARSETRKPRGGFWRWLVGGRSTSET